MDAFGSYLRRAWSRVQPTFGTASMTLSGAMVGAILVSLEIGSIEHGVKLSSSAFPSSGHSQHVQIENLTEGRGVRVWHNHIDN